MTPVIGQTTKPSVDTLSVGMSATPGDSVYTNNLAEAITLYQDLTRQRNEVVFIAGSIALVLILIVIFLISQKRKSDRRLQQKNSIIEKMNANLNSAQAHLVDLEKMVFHNRLSGVTAQEIQVPMKIELTGVHNKVVITLTDKLLTIDLVSDIVRIQISPEMSVKSAFELMQKTLQKYESIPTKELKKARPPKRFNFR